MEVMFSSSNPHRKRVHFFLLTLRMHDFVDIDQNRSALPDKDRLAVNHLNDGLFGISSRELSPFSGSAPGFIHNYCPVCILFLLLHSLSKAKQSKYNNGMDSAEERGEKDSRLRRNNLNKAPLGFLAKLRSPSLSLASK